MGSNFDKLKNAGLANDDFTADQKAEIEDLSGSTVDNIVSAANSSSRGSTLDGGGGQQ